jgi:hypothetical protein
VLNRSCLPDSIPFLEPLPDNKLTPEHQFAEILHHHPVYSKETAGASVTWGVSGLDRCLVFPAAGAVLATGSQLMDDCLRPSPHWRRSVPKGLVRWPWRKDLADYGVFVPNGAPTGRGGCCVIDMFGVYFVCDRNPVPAHTLSAGSARRGNDNQKWQTRAPVPPMHWSPGRPSSRRWFPSLLDGF